MENYYATTDDATCQKPEENVCGIDSRPDFREMDSGERKQSASYLVMKKIVSTKVHWVNATWQHAHD